MFENQKILILGFARSGYEAAKLLITRGNEVIINDNKKREAHDITKIEELEKMGVQFVLGGHPDDLLDSSFQYLIKNPGVPIDHKYVLKARELGIPVINETEMSYLLLPKDKNIQLIAITGTNGKTTTTTLVYEFVKKSGKRVHLVGNIGYPFCSFLSKLEDGDIIVDEVSCQQLENLDQFRPNVAILTNISEAHTDFMKTYEHYTEVKRKLFKNQDKQDVAILNLGNDESIRITKGISSTVKYFSSKGEINGAYIKDGAIYYYDELVVRLKDIRLIGMHNYENIMAAIMAVKEYQVSNQAIQEVLKEFNGVEHRLEFVAEVAGRKFYNDTEATNIKCCQIALSSFQEPVILFLGGLERGQDFTELKDYMAPVKAILAIGECRERVKQFGEQLGIPTYEFEFLKDAMPKAWEISTNGDIILLSPASASWDQYKQCEDRGAEFKAFVHSLQKNN
ncbi:MAG TPA: UDP-N-acetylmuramoyl-L-alanine--D-glutamate ligase [Candidatus Scybalousia intestinigallinarum]|nr:UDP-N-acetylmuramoyl-L-alanine--D-glutamate ligase [Candidatus Scybalousia intestinigallinarum]